eukprot:6475350-Ditylum_brightwellii.AAC.1
MSGSSLASMMASSLAQMTSSKMASSWALMMSLSLVSKMTSSWSLMAATSSYDDVIKLSKQLIQAWYQ